MKNRTLKIQSILLMVIIIALAVCHPIIGFGAETTGSSGTEAVAETTGSSGTEAAAEATGSSGTEAVAETTGSSGTEAAAETTGSEADAAGKKVYFAGPLFNDAERDYNLKIVNLLESYGYEVFLPQRDGFLAPEVGGMTEEEKIKIIFDKDRDEVLKADIIFVNLDGRAPDEGACVELGIGYQAGKRCYGIKNDARAAELGLDLNPMIAGCFIKLFYNLDGEELFQSLEEYLKENSL